MIEPRRALEPKLAAPQRHRARGNDDHLLARPAQRGNVLADTLHSKSSTDKVFSCGDMRRGQSLVVWAIREGRQCARAIDLHLMGATDLPR